MNRTPDVGENGKLTINYWLKIASVIFAAWAAMIPLGIWWLEKSLEGFTGDLRDNMIAHRTIDHRLDILEERQQGVLRHQNEQDEHLRYNDTRIEQLIEHRR
jgi:hypothetical protein